MEQIFKCLSSGSYWGFPGNTFLSDTKDSACNAGDLGLVDALKKGMVTHSIILAWRIP